MSSQVEGSLKRTAITAVLTRLGEDNLDTLKRNLRKDFYIDWDADTNFTIEELQIALQRLLGPYGANMIVREIKNEIQSLSPR